MLQTFAIAIHCHICHGAMVPQDALIDVLQARLRKSGAVSAQLEVFDTTQPLAQDMLHFSWEAAKNMIKTCQVAGCLHVL